MIFYNLFIYHPWERVQLQNKKKLKKIRRVLSSNLILGQVQIMEMIIVISWGKKIRRNKRGEKGKYIIRNRRDSGTNSNNFDLSALWFKIVNLLKIKSKEGVIRFSKKCPNLLKREVPSNVEATTKNMRKTASHSTI